jgi:hypothetical protein
MGSFPKFNCAYKEGPFYTAQDIPPGLGMSFEVIHSDFSQEFSMKLFFTAGHTSNAAPSRARKMLRLSVQYIAPFSRSPRLFFYLTFLQFPCFSGQFLSIQRSRFEVQRNTTLDVVLRSSSRAGGCNVEL